VTAGELLALVLLAAVLAAATQRRVPEAAVAVPAAALLVALGVVPRAEAADELRGLLPTVGFLAAVLVLAQLCDAEGVFAYAGAVAARVCRGSPVRLLAAVVGLAAAVTAVLSLDATVVLLTPVVVATATTVRVRPRPHVYVCAHLANSASLLLPVSNLTNLLAFGATGLTFLHFGLLMALPWLAAVAVEYAVLRLVFAADLRSPATVGPLAALPAAPVVPLVVLAATLAGFAVTSALGVAPAWAAAAGAAVLATRRLARRTTGPGALLRAADLPFVAFVLGLGIVVRAIAAGGLGDLVRRLLPGPPTLLGLLATAALAALLANLVNNLPAVLILLPAVAPGGAALVLAALLGVNVGPNLTYTGSLATLLWRRLLQRREAGPSFVDYLRLGAVSVPLVLLASTGALWLSLRVVGT
jgi:arsenical pump membrane protein